MQVILTYGHSNTVRDFLLHGRKKRNFRVVVCESGPSLKGHRMAKELSDGGIETTLIPDSATFAIIHAVNKVKPLKYCIDRLHHRHDCRIGCFDTRALTRVR